MTDEERLSQLAAKAASEGITDSWVICKVQASDVTPEWLRSAHESGAYIRHDSEGNVYAKYRASELRKVGD